MTRPNFRAGWWSRPDTVEGAARKILETLSEFARFVPELREWSCEDPPFVRAPQTVDYVSRRLEESAKGLKFPDLGYSFGAWSGGIASSYRVSIIVGSSSRIVPNRVNLALPVASKPTREAISEILSTLVRVWKPEFAAFNPVNRKEERRFELGEIVFLPAQTEAYLGDTSAVMLNAKPFESGRLYTLRPEDIERLYRQAASTAS